MAKKTINDRHPNFRYKSKLYLVRCFSCGGKKGRENYGPAVASGQCAWCGWEEEKKVLSKSVQRRLKIQKGEK